MQPRSVLWLLVLGIGFHSAYLWSVFDIYFRSPLVHGMTPISSVGRLEPPAKRLVLFVGTCLVMPCLHASTLIAGPIRYPRLSRLCSKLTSLLIAFNAMVYVVIMLLPTALLLVADGLRADRLFEQKPIGRWEATEAHGELGGEALVDRAPFLREVVHKVGAYGVSHTRVPTESRPGHVAMIAGFYEDVSAVTKGWKMNPVNFDSVLNQSRHTWSFGSPDILPMFKHGASDPLKIETFMYAAESEDFSGDGSILDTWVFDRVRALFNNATEDAELNKHLRQDKVVFFLHLLGLDTNGHAHRPHSKEYIRNIRLVDTGIKEVVRLVENFYGDDRTAFVFSADHGMSNIGNHGDGNPDNTRTPLIAWGAGVRGPLPSDNQDIILDDDGEFPTQNWHLRGIKRDDVRQADIAPLMSALIGLDYPVNSVGVLPVSYLNSTAELRATALAANAKQILAQFIVKEDMKRRTEPLFSEFDPPQDFLSKTVTNNAAPSASNDFRSFDKIASSLLAEKRFAEAETHSLQLIELCLQGLRYYQTYDWLFLRTIVSLGYLGWIFYSSLFVAKTYMVQRALSGDSDGQSSRFNNMVNVAFAVGSIILCALLIRKSSPWLYYIYAFFPLLFWHHVIKERHILLGLLHDLYRRTHWWEPILRVILCILALEILVISYFERAVLGVWFLALGWLWPWFLKRNVRQKHRRLLIGWCVSCTATSLFMYLPVELQSNQLLANVGAAAVVAIGILVTFIPDSALMNQRRTKGQHAALLFQVLLVMVAAWTVTNTTAAFRDRRPLPPVNQAISWAVLLVSFVMPAFTTSRHYVHRMVVLFLAFGAPLVLLAVSYETLFYALLGVNLYVWLQLERAIYADRAVVSIDWLLNGDGDDGESVILESDKRPARSGETSRTRSTRKVGSVIDATLPVSFAAYRALSAEDIRVAVLFLFYINVAFFGTGNVASLASFQLSSIYRLTTMFDPFLMAALLVVKILIPFLLLSAVFGMLSMALDLPPFSLFLFAVATTDVITLNFFFLVRDNGSWLEIGTSISHFVIASTFEVLSVLLFGLSSLLVSGVHIGSGVGGRQQKAVAVGKKGR